MAPKRSSSGGTPQAKAPRTSNSAVDFSENVRQKLSSSTRTGQACDRCKVRKIRCDGRPQGCSNCIANKVECKTTDRITGLPVQRGHVQALEFENTQLKNETSQLRKYVLDLSRMLEERSVEVPPPPVPVSNGIQYSHVPAVQINGQQLWSAVTSSSNGSYSSLASLPPGDGELEAGQANLFRVLPPLRAGCNGDNYLGVSSPESVLSPIKGMALSVFGMEIDLAQFVPSEPDDRTSPTSYQFFLDVAMGKLPAEKPELPPYEECQMYVNWFFRGLHPYTPMLHKPAFMQMLDRVYNEPLKGRPSIAEIVQLHMVLALIKYQYAIRNSHPNAVAQRQAFLEASHAHYKYATSHFRELVQSRTIGDLQALVLICIQVRNFPKPGAAWWVSATTLNIAVELGLHRSVKSCAPAAPNRDPLEIDLRKRNFWVIYALNVGLSGKLGRPMAVRAADIDVEFPEPQDDFLPGENPPGLFHRCSYNVGIQTIKVMTIYNKMYSTIYAVAHSTPDVYEANVRQLEQDLDQWRRNIPPELSDSSRAGQEDRVFALYLQFWEQELNLLFHHPGVCWSANSTFIESNYDKCLKSASNMLHVVKQLQEFRSLDFPWMNITLYLAAIFTTLFVYTERKDTLLSRDIEKLRNEMEQWLEVIGYCGVLLGTGDRLQTSTRHIVESALHFITHHLEQKTASQVATAALSHPSAHASIPGGYGTNFGESSEGSTESKPPSYVDPALQPTANPYPNVTAAPYTPTTTVPMIPHQYPYHPFQAQAESSPWRQWTHTLVTNLPPQEYVPASALMALGGREGPAQTNEGMVDMSNPPAQQNNSSNEAVAQQQPQGQVWPQLIFDIGHNVNAQ